MLLAGSQIEFLINGVVFLHGFVFCGKAWGGQGILTFEMTFRPAESAVSVPRVGLNMLRNDLKIDETTGTGGGCSGVEGVKIDGDSGADESHVPVFQCTHRPPRARSTIAILYDLESGDQGQSMQSCALNATGKHGEVEIFSTGKQREGLCECGA
ncbi:hypothetical protein [Gimesia chilikensis]|uniref:hypothetical protein n=1 Tax=Gimesia chilikensis TaxID=2605989 RepID=UPI00119F08CF|nr:hypothetical protein [Gimesia chilikensis]